MSASPLQVDGGIIVLRKVGRALRVSKEGEEANVALIIDSDLVLDTHQDRIGNILNAAKGLGNVRISKILLIQDANSKEMTENATRHGITSVFAPGEDVKVIYLALETLEASHNDQIDTIVIGTESSEIFPVLSATKEGGKRVVVIGREDRISEALRSVADEVLFMNDI